MPEPGCLFFSDKQLQNASWLVRAVGDNLPAKTRQLDTFVARFVHLRRLDHDMVGVEASDFVADVRAFVGAAVPDVREVGHTLRDHHELLKIELVACLTAMHLDLDVAVLVARRYCL